MIEVRRQGPVAVVTLARPEKLNALSAALERALAAALEGDEVRGARAVVFTGAGKAFSAGADTTELGGDPERIRAYYRDSGDVYERVAALPQPTLSAIAGWCLGGGLELALATDFRVADPSAVFGLPEVGIGIVPSSGGTVRLCRLLGPAKAKELVLLRERVRAHEALGLGLVTELAPTGRALDRAVALAERLAALPPLAAAVAKEAIDLVPEASRAAGVALERLAYGMLAQVGG